jgi:tRNA-Thr(GGU) m(6)t(6)A37 methyltransferase TsaA
MATIKFIGQVRSSLKELKDCPLQESEAAPQATIIIEPEYRQAVLGLSVGSSILVFTWLHKSNRDTLTTKPRNDPDAETAGVFATRSPDRPNPIGMHEAEIIAISNGQIKISNLEVIDGTPVIDIKPVL